MSLEVFQEWLDDLAGRLLTRFSHWPGGWTKGKPQPATGIPGRRVRDFAAG